MAIEDFVNKLDAGKFRIIGACIGGFSAGLSLADALINKDMSDVTMTLSTINALLSMYFVNSFYQMEKAYDYVADTVKKEGFTTELVWNKDYLPMAKFYAEKKGLAKELNASMEETIDIMSRVYDIPVKKEN